jgi:anti-sigma B factor antagonist
MLLSVVVETRAAHGLIRAVGELDFSSSETLRAAAEGVLAEGHETLLIDLSEVRFLDSTGLSALVAVGRAAARRGSSVGLIAPSEPVLHVLRLMGVDNVFPTYASESEALRGE